MKIIGMKRTISYVEDHIGRGRRTIYRWIKEGLISPERDDRGNWLFSEDDIKRLEEIKEEKTLIKTSGIGKAVIDDEQ